MLHFKIFISIRGIQLNKNFENSDYPVLRTNKNILKFHFFPNSLCNLSKSVESINNKNAIQQDAYCPLVDHIPCILGGLPNPPGGRPTCMQTSSQMQTPPLEAGPSMDAEPPGHVTYDACWETNLPWTDTCENITLPQTLWVVEIYSVTFHLINVTGLRTCGWGRYIVYKSSGGKIGNSSGGHGVLPFCIGRTWFKLAVTSSNQFWPVVAHDKWTV